MTLTMLPLLLLVTSTTSPHCQLRARRDHTSTRLPRLSSRAKSDSGSGAGAAGRGAGGGTLLTGGGGGGGVESMDDLREEEAEVVLVLTGSETGGGCELLIGMAAGGESLPLGCECAC
jgi:hypothetical protein